MVKKMSDGYRCTHCGDIISDARKARGHEAVCSESELTNFLGDEVGKIANVDPGEFEQTESTQLKIGEQLIGKCTNCGNKITTDDRYPERENFYECSGCENVVTKK